MSQETNTLLLERAAECVEYFEGKLPAELITADIERQDLEALDVHVCAAEAVMAEQEFEWGDVL